MESADNQSVDHPVVPPGGAAASTRPFGLYSVVDGGVVLINFIVYTILHRTIKLKESTRRDLATQHGPARLVRPSKYRRES